MMVYEYRCKQCGDQVALPYRLEDEQPGEVWCHGELSEDPCGPLKRTWSVGFQIKSTDWGH